MGTIIGQPERIAVEFELSPADDEDTRKWLFGHMCLWAGGHRIGRHDEPCAMTVAMAGFPLILRDKGNRSDPALMAMPARAAFRTIHGALYGAHDNLSYGEVVALARPFERFVALDRGFDLFDGWDAYLIEDRMVGRLIWRSPDRRIRETRFGAGEFDRVIDGFLTTLEAATGYKRRPPGE